MKMSKENYEKFKKFYDLTVESATDENVNEIMSAIKKVAIRKVNPKINDHNATVIRNFFENFLANAGDDDAIYLIEVLKSASEKIDKDPESVAKFVIMKKKEAEKKNGKKN